MTEQQFNLIMAAIAAVSRGERLTWNSNLVGGGVIQPPAPQDAAANPGQWAGTQWDPLNIDNISIHVVQVFETISGAFVGGKLTDWYRRDPQAAKDYYKARYKVDLDLSKLAASQRALMGL